jgi:hypothetical protein
MQEGNIADGVQFQKILKRKKRIEQKIESIKGKETDPLSQLVWYSANSKEGGSIYPPPTVLQN